MKSKKITIILTLFVFMVFLLCVPAAAQTIDSDGDGVPDDVENGVPGLIGIVGDGDGSGILDSFEPAVASFTSPDGRYMTLVIMVPDPQLKLGNVTAMESPEGVTFSIQAAESVPFGFFKFDVIGVPAYQPFTIALILNGDPDTVDQISDMVRYGSYSCLTSLDDPVFDYAQATVTGPFVNIFLTNGQVGDPNCPPKDSFSFIGAPAIGELLDTDGDGELVFDDNCPDIYNPEQTDTDNDGMGDECDICPADPDNDIDGDGICGDVDNCPAVYNFNQLDANYNGTGDQCEVDEEITVCSYLGNRFWRFFRDHDVWEIYAKAGEIVAVTLEANPKNRGHGKKINLILFSKTRGARLLRLDRSALDPDNKIEVLIPKDGKYGIVVGESFWWGRGSRYKGEYCLTIRASQEILDSLTPTPSVGKWWQ